MPRSNGRSQRRTRGVRLKAKKLAIQAARSGGGGRSGSKRS
jgi:hypothetical protein